MTIHCYIGTGDQNCETCHGPCKLSQDERDVSHIATTMAEYFAWNEDGPSFLVRLAFKHVGVDFNAWVDHAEKVIGTHRNPKIILPTEEEIERAMAGESAIS